MGVRKWVVLTTDEERWLKLVLMHQASLREFQQEFKFGLEKISDGINTEVSLWGYKYR